MTRNNKLLLTALIVVSLYAFGLTFGMGFSRISEGIDRKIVRPYITDKFLVPQLEDYAEVACPTGDSLVVAYFGQSNATNTVEPQYAGEFPGNLLQWDWRTSKCFAYQEPLLGADFTRGNVISYTAVRIAAATDKPVVIVPFGFGPSTILEWAFGPGAIQQDVVFTRLKAAGISPQVFLWHHGETDVPFPAYDEKIVTEAPRFRRPEWQGIKQTHHLGLSEGTYADALGIVMRRTLDAFPDARFGIALASHAACLGWEQNWEPLRAAQRDVVDSDPRAFISADSDAIRGIENRYDTCHFSAAGAKQLGDQYYQSVAGLDIL